MSDLRFWPGLVSQNKGSVSWDTQVRWKLHLPIMGWRRLTAGMQESRKVFFHFLHFIFLLYFFASVIVNSSSPFCKFFRMFSIIIPIKIGIVNPVYRFLSVYANLSLHYTMSLKGGQVRGILWTFMGNNEMPGDYDVCPHRKIQNSIKNDL